MEQPPNQEVEKSVAKTASRSLDVTQGVIWKQLLKLCLPVFFSSFFQQAYSLINVFVVGHSSGSTTAVAAVQATSALTDLVVGFSVGMGVGFSIVVAQYFGAHEQHKLSVGMHTAMGIALAFGALCSVVGVLLCGSILSWMGTPQDIFAEAQDFARVYLGAMIFSVTFNTGSALQRAVGDTRTPAIIVASSCVVNVLMDLLFVLYLDLGARGCGIATACSLAFGSLATLWQLTHVEGAWRIRLRDLRIDPKMARVMVKTGLPLALQSSAYTVSNIIVQSAINSFGTSHIAAWGLSGRLDSPVWTVSEALGSSVTTFSAQNFGARNHERMRKGLHTSLLMTVVVIGGLASTVMALAHPLSIFFLQDDRVANLTTQVIMTLGPFYLCYSVMANFAGTIRGSGESLRPMLLTLFGTCLLRVVWLLVFIPRHHDFTLVLMSYPATWIITAVLFALYYRYGHWMRHAADHEAERMAL